MWCTLARARLTTLVLVFVPLHWIDIAGWASRAS